MWDLIVSVPDHCLSFYFYFRAVLVVGVPFPIGVRAGCGIRLYRFLIIAFLSTLHGVYAKIVKRSADIFVVRYH